MHPQHLLLHTTIHFHPQLQRRIFYQLPKARGGGSLHSQNPATISSISIIAATTSLSPAFLPDPTPQLKPRCSGQPKLHALRQRTGMLDTFQSQAQPFLPDSAWLLNFPPLQMIPRHLRPPQRVPKFHHSQRIQLPLSSALIPVSPCTIVSESSVPDLTPHTMAPQHKRPLAPPFPASQRLC